MAILIIPGYTRKDPQARKDYAFDFRAATHNRPDQAGDWLVAGETITAATVTPEAGLTVTNIVIVNDTVTYWVEPGGTVGMVYGVTIHVTTSAGREDDVTARFLIEDQ